MAKLFRLLFLALFATALVWAAVIWHWQRTQRAIEVHDIVLYLLVLPLLVVGGVLALRWAWRRASLAQAAAVATAADAPAATVAAPPVAERQLAMRVLAQGVAAPGADDAAALLEVLTAPPPVQIDPMLRDMDGLAVFTRRCAEVDEADAMERAMALAERCMAPVLQQLHALAAASQEHAAPVDPAPAHPTVVTPRRPMPEKKGLRVLWAVEEQLDEARRAPLQARITETTQRWAAQLPAFDWRVELAPVRSGEALLLQAERRLLMAHREARDELLLVVAATSNLDEALVEQLDAAGQLFTAQRRTGLMPGEAATALLLAPPAPEGSAAGGVQLHRLSAQRRDKSADAAGRVTAATLTETLRQLIEAAALPPEQLTLVLSDTDLRPSRTGELFEALQQAAPHLASLELTRCAGTACGAIGLVAAPLALALAAERTQQQREATLVLAHADPFDRLAAVLSPSPDA